MKISEKIKSARAKSGLTQEDVAESLEISRQTLSNWENAKTLPDISSVIKMSDLYQVSLDELLKGDVTMTKKIEKDEKTLENNNRAFKFIIILAVIIIIARIIGNFVRGPVSDFITGASPFVLLGLGIIAFAAYSENKTKDDVGQD